MQCNLQGILISGLKDLKELLNKRSSSYNNTANGEHSKSNLPEMDWAIPERTQR